ncbi:MAG: GNAT family N-acetyltransferase, partial [Minwuia sp.]|nr:GNAT family N-acetyltransferase [Minwuia sp.]
QIDRFSSSVQSRFVRRAILCPIVSAIQSGHYQSHTMRGSAARPDAYALVGDEIGGLFLLPEMHGRGLGRVLTDHAVGLHGPLRVEAFAKNHMGRRFYDRYGFVETDRYLHEPSGEMTIRMAMPAV